MKMTTIYRAPEGVDPLPALGRGEQVRVPMKGRTETVCRAHGESDWCSDCGGSPSQPPEQRLVAPIQPATPCPDCTNSSGYVGDEHGSRRCLECRSGLVGGDLGLVTEQWRNDGGRWRTGRGIEWCPPTTERRLVVAHRTQVTELLPVLAPGRRPDAGAYIVVGTDGAWMFDMVHDHHGGHPVPFSRSMALGLTPGMFVATLVGLWPIDPPVVDMPCQNPKHAFGCVDDRVPLSVDPGGAVTLP